MLKKIRLKKNTFLIESPNIIDEFLDNISDQDDFNEDEIPYWSEIWTSSIVMGKFILKNPHIFYKKKCLDLGCGLGLVSMALKCCNAIVYSQDIIYNSLIFLKKNFDLNKITYPLCIQGDWRNPCFKKNSFDVIVASDILYEKRFHIPILKFITLTLKKKGICYIATPKREGAFDFFDYIKDYNLSYHLIKRSNISKDKIKSDIYLWKIYSTF